VRVKNYEAPHYAVSPILLLFLLGPNILFNNLFSNTICLFFSRNMREQVPHPYGTAAVVIL
jgi:hypothetical protein